MLLERTIGGFKPYDDEAQEMIKKYPIGKAVRCKITNPRNPAFHRKFFALLRIAFDNQERYPTLTALRTVVTCMTGHCDVIKEKATRGEAKGQQVFMAIPRSISFARMDSEAFEIFYNKAVEVVATRIMPGVDRGDLNQAVMDRINEFRS